jgi:serine/threonine protein phosphatase PrpC
MYSQANKDSREATTEIWDKNATLKLKRFQPVLNFKEVLPLEDALSAGNNDGCEAGKFATGGKFAAVCSVGYQVEEIRPNRAVNEDGYFKIEVGNKIFLCVGDGIGGAPAGEVACGVFLKKLSSLLKMGMLPHIAIKQAALELEAEYARLKEYSEHVLHDIEDPLGMGMCFTLAEITDHGDKKDVVFHHCGDCKAVLAANGKIIHATKDHTEADEDPDLSVDDEDYFRKKATVTHCVALYKKSGDNFYDEVYRHIPEGTLHPDYFHIEVTKPIEIPKGGQLLLATDGLFDNMQNEFGEQLLLILDHTESGPNKQKNLVQNLSNLVIHTIDGGGGKRDNMAIIAAGF